MLADAQASETPLDGPGGILNQFTQRVIERALGAELDDHLGYVKGDPAGNGSGNSRNGSFGKTVITSSGPARIDVPRDRNGSFEPRIVRKGQRRLAQIDDMILSLYARGMTTRDIRAHLGEVYGAEVSPELISRVTEVVREEIIEWQTRPLDRVYVIMYIDAVVVKIRADGVVSNRPAYIVTGVDTDGFKHVLGLWIGTSEGEGAKYWMSVLSELHNRGVEDVMIVCCCPTRSARSGRMRSCRPHHSTLLMARRSRRSPRHQERTYADALPSRPHADPSLLVEAGRVVASGSCASSAVMRFQYGRLSVTRPKGITDSDTKTALGRPEIG